MRVWIFNYISANYTSYTLLILSRFEHASSENMYQINQELAFKKLQSLRYMLVYQKQDSNGW
mgnify:CR=1 FL=1